jgi:hypothetical protein
MATRAKEPVAEVLLSSPAEFTLSATGIQPGHACTVTNFKLAYLSAESGNNANRLMPRYDGQAWRCYPAFYLVEFGTANTAGLYFEKDIFGSGCGNRYFL